MTTGETSSYFDVAGCVHGFLLHRRNHMYWTDVSRRLLMRSNLDGSQVTTLLSIGLRQPGDIHGAAHLASN